MLHLRPTCISHAKCPSQSSPSPSNSDNSGQPSYKYSRIDPARSESFTAATMEKSTGELRNCSQTSDGPMSAQLIREDAKLQGCSLAGRGLGLRACRPARKLRAYSSQCKRISTGKLLLGHRKPPNEPQAESAESVRPPEWPNRYTCCVGDRLVDFHTASSIQHPASSTEDSCDCGATSSFACMTS